MCVVTNAIQPLRKRPPSLHCRCAGGVQFGESLLSRLLYADDLVILAENEETMQALLKKVGDWCSVWGINVNSNKSAVLHFRQPTLPLTGAIFTLGVMQIPIVKYYTYLGIIVDEFTTYQDTVQAKIAGAAARGGGGGGGGGGKGGKRPPEKYLGGASPPLTPS